MIYFKFFYIFKCAQKVIVETASAQSGSTVTIDTYYETSWELEGSFQFVAGDPIGQDDTTFTITEGVFSVTVQ